MAPTGAAQRKEVVRTESIPELDFETRRALKSFATNLSDESACLGGQNMLRLDLDPVSNVVRTLLASTSHDVCSDSWVRVESILAWCSVCAESNEALGTRLSGRQVRRSIAVASGRFYIRCGLQMLKDADSEDSPSYATHVRDILRRGAR